MEPATFGNYIDGEWTPSAAGRTFENRNPADTTALVGRFADSGPEDVERAVAAARAAFPKWKALPAPKRGEILYRAAEILVKLKEDHSRDMTREMGKVLDETRGDVQEAIELASRAEGQRNHTAVMHSTNIEHLSWFAKKSNANIFVKNGPNYAGLGFGGEGTTTMTIAGSTGEGITTARTFTRRRRCALIDSFRII